jgi:hypothetical protein
VGRKRRKQRKYLTGEYLEQNNEKHDDNRKLIAKIIKEGQANGFSY